MSQVAKDFTRHGLTALTFDYRCFGESEGEPRQLISTRRQRQDLGAALEFARRLKGVDPHRVALWGYSYGAGHAVNIAGHDHRVAAIVARAPFVDGLTRALAMPPGKAVELLRSGIRDQLRGLAGEEPAYLPLIGPPGSDALYADPGEGKDYRRMVASSKTWRNYYAPRVNLYGATFRPITQARQLRCPILVTSAERDLLALPETAIRLVKRAARGELRSYPADHFSLNEGEVGARVSAAEGAWLADILR